MCDIWKRDTVEEISLQQLEAQMESIDALRVEWVVFTGGEPLMHSELFDLCRPFRERGIRLTLLSSGLLLERFAEQIVQNFDDVIVSLDGPQPVHDRIRRVEGAFVRTGAGIAQIRRLRADFRISARCTVQRGNAAELVETWRAAHELGLDSISFLAADLTSDAFNRQRGESKNISADLQVLEDQLGRLVATGECGSFILESPAKLLRLATRGTSPPCNAPWVSAVLEADGTVRPCFFHKPIGRVDEEHTLFDVINGPQAVAFRDQLDIATNPICRQCVCSLNRPLAHPAQ